MDPLPSFENFSYQVYPFYSKSDRGGRRRECRRRKSRPREGSILKWKKVLEKTVRRRSLWPSGSQKNRRREETWEIRKHSSTFLSGLARGKRALCPLLWWWWAKWRACFAHAITQEISSMHNGKLNNSYQTVGDEIRVPHFVRIQPRHV